MRRLLLHGLLLWAAALSLPVAGAELQTVCTITVNSADEREAFRRHLPAARYRFVELVERGRPEWLASACRAGVHCDILVISGHYDGGNQFFSEELQVREYLPVSELERVSCSESCPTLFSRLKEVHLYGCNTLNPNPQTSTVAELVRGLVRDGRSPKEAQRELEALAATHGQSSRDRMRQVFTGVPVIYGFTSAAPLGPVAGATLERFFAASGAREIGQGHVSGRLLGYFAPFALAAAGGMTEDDPHAATRRDMCRFADDRVSDARRWDFVHELLRRHGAETRLYLDRVLRLAATLDDHTRQRPDLARSLAAITADDDARARFIELTREAEQPSVRASMIDLARDLGWLTPKQRRQEFARMFGEQLARNTVGAPEVDLACRVNERNELDGVFEGQPLAAAKAASLPQAALRACLGDAAARELTLQGLSHPDETDVRMAQAYLHHRPITEPAELRRVAAAIARMEPSEAQFRALEALGRHYVSDRDVLAMMVRLFSQARSWQLQSAIAGILIRADRNVIARLDLERALRDDRLPSPQGESLVDALLQRLQIP